MYGNLLLDQLRIKDIGVVVKNKALKMFNSAEQNYRLVRERYSYFVFNAGEKYSVGGGNILKINQVK